MNRLGQQIGGIYYKSPIVVSSSPLTDRIELIKRAEDNGAGAVSTKLTLIKSPVKGVRRMYAEHNYFVFNNSDKRNELDEGVELVRKAKEQTDLVVWTNISGYGDDIESWIQIAKAMEDAGADALELNFCCGNMSVSDESKSKLKIGSLVAREPELMRDIILALKGAVKIPVWAKGATLFAVENAKIVEQAGGDGIVTGGAGGLCPPPINIFNKGVCKVPGAINGGYGGTNGPSFRPLTYRAIHATTKVTNLPVAGGGGLADYTHIIEAIMFGASLTCMCSKLLMDGFGVIKTINEQLEKFMEEQGYKTIEDMRGLALKHLVAASDKLEYSFSVPTVDEEKCSGCGSCSRIGSCTAITIKDKRAVVDPKECEQCGLCVTLCPRGAIRY